MRWHLDFKILIRRGGDLAQWWMPWVQASAPGAKKRQTKILTVTDISEALRGEMTHENI